MYDRYKVIKATRDQGQVHGYSVRDTQYPIVKYPFFETKKEAEIYIASEYGLTLEEYKRLHGQNGQKRQRIKNDNKPQEEE